MKRNGQKVEADDESYSKRAPKAAADDEFVNCVETEDRLPFLLLPLLDIILVSLKLLIRLIVENVVGPGMVDRVAVTLDSEFWLPEEEEEGKWPPEGEREAKDGCLLLLWTRPVAVMNMLLLLFKL